MVTPVALVTGGGRRIGSEIVQLLHQHGYRVIIHYLRSSQEANSLSETLNSQQPNSASTIKANLCSMKSIEQLAQQSVAVWGRLDVLINNASSYYPTPFGQVMESQWDDLMSSNLKGPFFLSQALTAELTRQQGVIINIADIHSERPAINYSPYSIAKAGNAMLTKCLARELAPKVRVNGVAPGVILWPEKNAKHSIEEKEHILHQIPLRREGTANDIAQTVLFLLKNAPYVTGQILAVDGGRSVYI